MEDFKSIKIIHNVDNRIEFLFFGEFFRLCGIYVGESIQRIDMNDPSNALAENAMQAGFDVELHVGLFETDDITSANLNAILLRNILPLMKNPVTATSFSGLSKAERQELLLLVLQQVKNYLSQKQITFEDAVFDKLSGIYVSQDMLKYLANIQYYRIDYDRQEETKQAFMSAYEHLRTLELKSRIIDYATLYCASKANVASYCQDEYFVYEVEKLADECIQLIRMYPSFSNAWVLRGLIYEYDTEFAREAVSAFEKAVEDEGEHSCTSHMLYWIARRYEAYTVNEEEAFTYYQKSYLTKPRFRNIYKLAMLSKKRDEYNKALEYFDLILENLKIKYKRGYLDPLECEYYYKANSLAAYLCCVCIKNYERAIIYSLNACEFVEKLEENKFFKDFYGEQSEDYRKVTRDRMNLNKIYQYLAVSNRELKRFDEAQEWRDKIIDQEF